MRWGSGERIAPRRGVRISRSTPSAGAMRATFSPRLPHAVESYLEIPCTPWRILLAFKLWEPIGGARKTPAWSPIFSRTLKTPVTNEQSRLQAIDKGKSGVIFLMICDSVVRRNG